MTIDDKQNRFKSKTLWLGIVSEIGVILMTFGVFDDTSLAKYKVVVTSVLGILGALSIVNNPTSKNYL